MLRGSAFANIGAWDNVVTSHAVGTDAVGTGALRIVGDITAGEGEGAGVGDGAGL